MDPVNHGKRWDGEHYNDVYTATLALIKKLAEQLGRTETAVAIQMQLAIEDASRNGNLGRRA